VRQGVGVVAVALVAACATGGDGMLTSVASSLATASDSSTASDTSAASPDTSTASGDSTTDSAGVDSTSSGTTSSDGSETGSGSSGDTGVVPACEAELETFAANPAWTVMGLPDEGTVFGWGATAYAGGASGEIGGTLQRSGNAQYYADTTIVVVSGDCVAAQGRLVAPMEDSDFNSLVGFGHFSTGGVGPHIGFSFGEGANSTLRVFMTAGGASQEAFTIQDIATPREWSYEYDPVAGMMTLEMEGLGSQSIAVAPAAVAGIAGIDAFGMFKTAHDTPEDHVGLLGVYLDEITYTR
jgi:hypothetical protein